MDIRILRYFLAVAREETINGAANYLHVSQPTLSRQLMDAGLVIVWKKHQVFSWAAEKFFQRMQAQSTSQKIGTECVKP